EKNDESIADLTIAARLNTQLPSTWANRANAYLRKEEYHQAIADATRSIEMRFLGYRPYVARAIAHSQLGEFKGALEDLDQAERFARSYATIYILRAAVYAKMGDFKKSDAEWAEAKKRNDALTEENRVTFAGAPKPLERKKLNAADTAALAVALREAEKALNESRFVDGLKSADEACRLDPTSPPANSLGARL